MEPQNELWQEPKKEVVIHREIRRLTWRNVGWEFAEAFNIIRGLLYTMRGLTLHPARTIREYLNEGRFQVLNPIRYFILVVGIVLFVASRKGYFERTSEAFKVEVNGEANPEKVHQAEERIAEAYQEYFVKYQNFWSIGSISLTALFTWLFFLKSGYTYLEHLAINTYIFLHTYWIFFIGLLLDIADGIWLIAYFVSYLVMMIVVFKQLTAKRWVSAILRTVAALVITFTLFGVLMASAVVWYALKGPGVN